MPALGAEMLPYQEKTGKGVISLVVRASHLKSAFRMRMKYTINKHPASNAHGDVEITQCYFDGKPWPSRTPGEERLQRLVPTRDVVRNFNLALKYFVFVVNHLDQSKDDPPTFRDFLRSHGE